MVGVLGHRLVDLLPYAVCCRGLLQRPATVYYSDQPLRHGQ